MRTYMLLALGVMALAACEDGMGADSTADYTNGAAMADDDNQTQTNTNDQDRDQSHNQGG